MPATYQWGSETLSWRGILLVSKTDDSAWLSLVLCFYPMCVASSPENWRPSASLLKSYKNPILERGCGWRPWRASLDRVARPPNVHVTRAVLAGSRRRGRATGPERSSRRQGAHRTPRTPGWTLECRRPARKRSVQQHERQRI